MKNTLLVCLGLGLGLALGSPSYSQESDEVGIKDADITGSGCQSEAIEVILDHSEPDGPLDIVRIKNPGLRVEDRGRKICLATINVTNPEGWSYSVAEVKTSGYMAIQTGVKATIANDVSIMGTSQKAKTKRVQKGFWEGRFQMNKEKPRPIWTVCGKTNPINIKQSFRLSGKSKNGKPSVISGGKGETGAVIHEYRLVWRACRS